MDKDFIYQPKTVRPIFLSLVLGVSLNLLLVLGNQFNIFHTIQQFLASLTVSSHHLLSTFVMGLFSGLFAWFGNSQVFALNSIADDSFALENLTYAVTHHSTTGIPHLYTLTNLYRSFGLVAGVGAVLALLVAILLVSRSERTESQPPQSVSKSLKQWGVFHGRDTGPPQPPLCDSLLIDPFGEYGDSSYSFVPQTDASSCLSGARWDT